MIDVLLQGGWLEKQLQMWKVTGNRQYVERLESSLVAALNSGVQVSSNSSSTPAEGKSSKGSDDDKQPVSTKEGSKDGKPDGKETAGGARAVSQRLFRSP